MATAGDQDFGWSLVGLSAALRMGVHWRLRTHGEPEAERGRRAEWAGTALSGRAQV